VLGKIADLQAEISPNHPVQISRATSPDVLDRLTISRSLLYELIKEPIQPFPAPVQIGRRSVWVTNEVEAYMISVINTSRGPK
jgi:predicted DNA-binding transcriptional regulator AlpA